MTEIWRDIKGYEGLYQISNLGRIKSLDHYVKAKGNSKRLVKGCILNLNQTKWGYYIVCLFKNGVRNYYSVHRLVAMTFPDLVDWTEDTKGKPFDEIVVNHKNQIKTDNRVDNLEWCTVIYNNNYGDRMIRANKNHSKPVLQFTKDMVFVAEYPSIKEATKQTGIYTGNITACCKGRLKTTGGFIWKYKG